MVQTAPDAVVAPLPLPSAPAALRDLQRALDDLRRDRLGGAIRRLERLHRKHPSEPAPAYFLALVRLRAGDDEGAVSPLEAAAAAAPASGEVQELLGHLRRRRGETAAAAEAYARALAVDPARHGAAHGLGVCHLRSGGEARAVEPLERAVALRPGEPRYLRDLGTALIFAGRPEQAVEAFQQVPEGELGAAGLANLGWAYELLGEDEQAWRCYDEALARDERVTAPYYKLARRGRYDDAEHLELLLDRFAGDAAACVDLHFALGEILHRRGEARRAFEHFRRGNRLAGVRHDRRARSLITLAPTLFAGREFFAERRWSDDGEGRVFIVGMPRLGTSLVEQILAAHRRVHALGENLFFGEVALSMGGREGIERAYPFGLLDLDAAVARQIAREYEQTLPAGLPSGTLTTDKAPANYVFLPLIALCFPRAKVIDLRRDPRDVALSLYFTHFRGGSCTFSYDLDDLAACLIDHHHAMEHWQAHLPVEMLELHYEELVHDPEGQSRRLLDFVGLDWDPACLDFHRRSGPCLTASHAQVRRPVYTSSIGRHRPYADLLQPLIDRLEQAGLAVGSHARVNSLGGGC
ncbi:MAG: sulfotransferase [Acidobacteriota bacterium]|nr:sulfotransferase [Acidobacteriota bacterium]